MKNLASTILSSVLAALSLAALVLAFIGEQGRRSTIRCKGIDVQVCDSAVNRFVDADKVRSTIDREYGGYRNIPLYEIRLSDMESLLQGKTFTKDAQCWVTGDGMLHVKLSQITPVARYEGPRGLMYISQDGRCIRTGEDWKKNLVCVTGELKQDDAAWMAALGSGAVAIQADPGLRSGADTLLCRRNGECELRIGGLAESFIIGMPRHLPERLGKIRTYRTKIHGSYSSVDLRYKGMIICKKYGSE